MSLPIETIGPGRDQKLLVIFASYNGRDVITRTLDGYCAVRAPTCPWHILVVDNASTDETARLASGYADRLPITVITCDVPGKNNALNAGLRYAKALSPSLYIFTDDDAVPAEDFLVEWEKVERGVPQATLFGGTITPTFLAAPEPWLEDFRFVYNIVFALNVGDDRSIAGGDIYGPNMAVRADVFDRGFTFNADIGPNSQIADYPMGSETEFCVRVEREFGALCWFVSGPKVGHLVRRHQATKRYIANRAFRHGRGYAFQEHLEDPVGDVHAKPFEKWAKDSVMRLVSKFASAKLFWRCHWGMGYRSERQAIALRSAKSSP